MQIFLVRVILKEDFYMNCWTIDEWTFALAIYPKFNAMDRYVLFLELLKNKGFFTDEDQNPYEKMKKLSRKKKASFACFLRELDVSKEMARYQKQGISWLYLYDEGYPERLAEIYCPPILLFYCGDVSILNKHFFLGVVGSRLATAYGLKVVDDIVPNIIHQSKGKVAIVSGLAKGIDGRAHEATISAKGRTIGVIGTGLDCYYPRENSLLQEKMMREELVVSEYPLGATPRKFHFPERNRIIAGLSRGVLVVEAKQRSGSLITAYNALDENRDVFACPGSLLQQESAGCHNLIQEGALLTTKSADILAEWSLI